MLPKRHDYGAGGAALPKTTDYFEHEFAQRRRPGMKA